MKRIRTQLYRLLYVATNIASSYGRGATYPRFLWGPKQLGVNSFNTTTMMASFSNSTDYYEGNINDLSCLLRPRSLVSSSESDSLKSIKSSATLLRHSSFLDDADSLILGTPPELCGSDSITPTALYMPFLPHANGVQNSLPNLTMPEASFHAFESAPDESKNTVNLLINDSELLDGPPIATSPFYTAFKPTVDRGLLEPQHLPDLDGYVQVQSHSNFTTLPVSDSPQKSQVLIPTDHISRLSPPAHSFNGPPPDPRSSLSSPDSFFTAPASLESSSDASFETALTTIEPVLSFHNPNDTSSVNILAAHLHPTPNGNIDQRSPTTREVPDSIPLGDVDPSLLQPHRIISHSKTDTVDTQSPQKSASFYLHHPDAQNPSLPKGPVHDGSLLSPGIHVIVSEAAALYEATQENRSSSPPGVSIFHLVSFFFDKSDII